MSIFRTSQVAPVFAVANVAGRDRVVSDADPSPQELLRALPGTGELMASVGRCFGGCWHAARAGNYDLAAYFVRRTRSLLRGLAFVRPKYRDQVAEYDRDHLEAVYQALLSRDLPGFERAYERAVERANFYHVDTGHAYIKWRTPEEPPDLGLDLNP
jgi:hypothetical protein